MKRSSLFFFVFVVFGLSGAGQHIAREAALRAKIIQAKNAGETVRALGDLADYYYTYKLDNAGDSVLNQQLFAAENARDKNLVLSVLFGNSITNINKWSSNETFSKAQAFIEKGLAYAKSVNREDYVALAYARLSEIYRKKGDLDNSFLQANMAFTSAQGLADDSVRALTAIQVADVYQDKHQSLMAFKNYNNAYDLALKSKNQLLQSTVYRRLSAMYQGLGNAGMAKEYLFKSLDLHKAHRDSKAQIEDYLSLVNLTDEKGYLDSAEILVASVRSEKHRLQALRLRFAYTILYSSRQEALDYFTRVEDIRYSYYNQGMPTVYWRLGELYLFNTQPLYDSALYYLKKAEPGFGNTMNTATQEAFFGNLAYAYEKTGATEQALITYKKALDYSSALKNLGKMVEYHLKICSLYKQKNDYKAAFDYLERGRLLKDSLQQLNKERDVVLLEVDRENKKLVAYQEREKAALLKKRNLQYMAITIAIAAFFFLLILIGTFPVSKLIIKVLGFFAFICLFEFIVLLIDTFLHSITHGEPLQIWLIKIFLIALLVPLQHFLEHTLTRFLASQKLVELRQQLTLKRWKKIHKKATPVEVAEPEITVL